MKDLSMPALPLVSIVTPAYNQAEYLAETIDSVLAQDYPHIEYIVLDDGSTDSTSEVLQRYDGRIRWERHGNMGQARTLNKGWSMSSGTIVGYLSSDDRLLPHAISTLVTSLQTDPRAIVVYCDFELIDSQGRTIRSVATEDFDRLRLIQDLVCQPGPGALFYKRVIEEAGAWNVNLRQIPDFEFWLRASRLGNFVRVKQVLAQYRIHEGSASFRPTSYDRSNEIVATMTEYWGEERGQIVSRSISNALLISAKSHAQSGRYMKSANQFFKALLKHPMAALSFKTWRIVTSGILRRYYYKILGSR